MEARVDMQAMYDRPHRPASMCVLWGCEVEYALGEAGSDAENETYIPTIRGHLTTKHDGAEVG